MWGLAQSQAPHQQIPLGPQMPLMSSPYTVALSSDSQMFSNSTLRPGEDSKQGGG